MTVDATLIEKELNIAEGGRGLRVWPAPDIDFSQPLCLFVHGYNVAPSGAYTAAGSLLDTIQRNHALPSVLSTRLWAVYWRGFVESWLSHDKAGLSAATYSAQIEPAKQAGRELANYIIGRRQPGDAPRIHVVGHSLGCRVVLEMLDECARHPAFTAAHFPVVILMAAAVPTFMIERLQRLWQGALLPARSIVLYSTKDYILWRPIFGVGQTLAGEGPLPVAVGGTGLPDKFWGLTVPTENDHSGYFTDAVTASTIVSEFDAAKTRILDQRSLADRVVEDAVPPVGRPQDERALKRRRQA